MPVTTKTKQIEEALLEKLGQLSPRPSVAWPNVAFTRVSNVPYLEPLFLPNRTDFGAIGSNAPRRYRGLFQIGVYYTLASGIADVTTLADRIMDHFDTAIIARGDVRVRIGSFDGSPGVPYRTGAVRDGTWYAIPVNVPWWCDIYE